MSSSSFQHSEQVVAWMASEIVSQETVVEIAPRALKALRDNAFPLKECSNFLRPSETQTEKISLESSQRPRRGDASSTNAKLNATTLQSLQTLEEKLMNWIQAENVDINVQLRSAALLERLITNFQQPVDGIYLKSSVYLKTVATLLDSSKQYVVNSKDTEAILYAGSCISLLHTLLPLVERMNGESAKQDKADSSGMADLRTRFVSLVLRALELLPGTNDSKPMPSSTCCMIWMKLRCIVYRISFIIGKKLNEILNTMTRRFDTPCRCEAREIARLFSTCWQLWPSKQEIVPFQQETTHLLLKTAIKIGDLSNNQELLSIRFEKSNRFLRPDDEWSPGYTEKVFINGCIMIQIWFMEVFKSDMRLSLPYITCLRALSCVFSRLWSIDDKSVMNSAFGECYSQQCALYAIQTCQVMLGSVSSSTVLPVRLISSFMKALDHASAMCNSMCIYEARCSLQEPACTLAKIGGPAFIGRCFKVVAPRIKHERESHRFRSIIETSLGVLLEYAQKYHLETRTIKSTVGRKRTREESDETSVSNTVINHKPEELLQSLNFLYRILTFKSSSVVVSLEMKLWIIYCTQAIIKLEDSVCVDASIKPAVFALWTVLGLAKHEGSHIFYTLPGLVHHGRQLMEQEKCNDLLQKVDYVLHPSAAAFNNQVSRYLIGIAEVQRSLETYTQRMISEVDKAERENRDRARASDEIEISPPGVQDSNSVTSLRDNSGFSKPESHNASVGSYYSGAMTNSGSAKRGATKTSHLPSFQTAREARRQEDTVRQDAEESSEEDDDLPEIVM